MGPFLHSILFSLKGCIVDNLQADNFWDAKLVCYHDKKWWSGDYGDLEEKNTETMIKVKLQGFFSLTLWKTLVSHAIHWRNKVFAGCIWHF